jgi:hypothetical protein
MKYSLQVNFFDKFYLHISSSILMYMEQKFEFISKLISNQLIMYFFQEIYVFGGKTVNLPTVYTDVHKNSFEYSSYSILRTKCIVVASSKAVESIKIEIFRSHV